MRIKFILQQDTITNVANSTSKIEPPKGSWLDSNGKRWTKILIDVMKNGGTRFVRQISITLGIHFDFGLGLYVSDINLEKITEEVIRQHPSLVQIKDITLIPTNNRTI